MTSRPTLARSVPFWVLFVGSLVVAAVGAWIAFTKLGTMVAGLTAQTATTADVYGGQSWIVLGAALLGAGLIGLVATLSLAVVRGLLAPAPAAVEQVDDVAVATDDLPFIETSLAEPAAGGAPLAGSPDLADAVAEPTPAEPAATAEPDVEPAAAADDTHAEPAVESASADAEPIADAEPAADATDERPAR